MMMKVFKVLCFFYLGVIFYSNNSYSQKNNSSQSSLSINYDFDIYLSDENLKKSKVIEASPKMDKLKFNMEIFGETPIKNSFFYLLSKDEDKIIAELTLVKIRKNIAYAEIGRITKKLSREDFKGLSIISGADIKKIIKTTETFRKNPYTDIGYLYSTGLLKSSNIISQLELDTIASSSGYYLTAFGPLNDALPWLNWFGFHFSIRNIKPTETKIVSLQKDIQQSVKVEGSQLSFDLIIRPWSNIPFIHNFSILTSLYNEKKVSFKLTKEEALKADSKSFDILNLIENTNALDMAYKEVFLLVGFDIGFNPHQNLFFGASYSTKLSHKFEIKNNLDKDLSESGTISGNIIQGWAKTYFPSFGDFKFFLKFVMDFHTEKIKKNNSELTQKYEESKFLIGIGYAP